MSGLWMSDCFPSKRKVIWFSQRKIMQYSLVLVWGFTKSRWTEVRKKNISTVFMWHCILLESGNIYSNLYPSNLLDACRIHKYTNGIERKAAAHTQLLFTFIELTVQNVWPFPKSDRPCVSFSMRYKTLCSASGFSFWPQFLAFLLNCLHTRVLPVYSFALYRNPVLLACLQHVRTIIASIKALVDSTWGQWNTPIFLVWHEFNLHSCFPLGVTSRRTCCMLQREDRVAICCCPSHYKRTLSMTFGPAS